MDSLNLLDQPAPDFVLYDLRGLPFRLSDQRGKIVVLNFWSTTCPTTQSDDQSMRGWLPMWDGAVTWWSVASNLNETPELLGQTVMRRGLSVVLNDRHQVAADLYCAQTTPPLVVKPLGLEQNQRFNRLSQ